MEQNINLEEALENARFLLEHSRLVEAEKKTEEILTFFPKNGQALYIKAVCQRYLNRLEDALKTLRALKEIRPGYGRAFQEEGHVCMAAVSYTHLTLPTKA